MLSRITGKTAVVTGASSGLGLEVARLLHAQGARVFALARRVNEADLPQGVVKVACNIRDLESIDRAFATIDAQAQRLDILVNCAGVRLIKNLEDTTRPEIMDVLGVNLKGNIYIAQEVYRRMLPHRAGYIVNVGSTSSLVPRADEPIYAASKWGLRGFTQSLEAAAAPDHIRVTGIYPGGMDTPFWNGESARDTSDFMPPKDLADYITQLLGAPTTLAISECIIKHGFKP